MGGGGLMLRRELGGVYIERWMERIYVKALDWIGVGVDGMMHRVGWDMHERGGSSIILIGLYGCSWYIRQKTCKYS